MHRIEPVIRDYAWGSHTALAQLAGRPHPTSEPEAELWVGAHEGSPAYVPAERATLDECISRDPAAALGECAPAWSGRLPFLLKILAADKALSIQAHPGPERAASASGYSDAWPKPEAWVPLEECEAFIGSLPFADAAAQLRVLGGEALTALVEEAAGAANPAHALLSALLRLPADAQRDVVEQVVARMEQHLPQVQEPAQQASWSCILRVHEQFPDDIGVVVLLTMRHHVMKPGTSTFLEAGVLHTFVRGTTIEILANSDNVVRAGLTSKEIDVDELLEIVDVDARVRPESPVCDGPVRHYVTPAEHFALHEVVLDENTGSVTLPGHGTPTLVLAVRGAVELHGGGESLRLAPLDAAWIPASHSAVTARCEENAQLFVATPGASA